MALLRSHAALTVLLLLTTSSPASAFITDPVGMVTRGIRDLFVNLFDHILGFFKSIFDKLVSTLRSYLSGLVDDFTSGLTEVTKVISDRLASSIDGVDADEVEVMNRMAHAGDLPPDYFRREVDAGDLAHVRAMLDEAYTVVYVALGFHLVVVGIIGYMYVDSLVSRGNEKDESS